MSATNHVHLIGNIRHDPEEHGFPSGKYKLKVSLAVNKTHNPSQTNWFQCDFWGKLADHAKKVLEKGMKIAVEGEIHIDKVDRDGGKQVYTYVTVDSFEIIDCTLSGREPPSLSAQSTGTPGDTSARTATR